MSGTSKCQRPPSSDLASQITDLVGREMRNSTPLTRGMDRGLPKRLGRRRQSRTRRCARRSRSDLETLDRRIIPNLMQRDALEALAQVRADGETQGHHHFRHRHWQNDPFGSRRTSNRTGPSPLRGSPRADSRPHDRGVPPCAGWPAFGLRKADGIVQAIQIVATCSRRCRRCRSLTFYKDFQPSDF